MDLIKGYIFVGCCLLGCDAVLSGRSSLILWGNALLPSSALKSKPSKQTSRVSMHGKSDMDIGWGRSPE
jgi:hypothetical protein